MTNKELNHYQPGYIESYRASGGNPKFAPCHLVNLIPNNACAKLQPGHIPARIQPAGLAHFSFSTKR